jgi:hypothetical protein
MAPVPLICDAEGLGQAADTCMSSVCKMSVILLMWSVFDTDRGLSRTGEDELRREVAAEESALLQDCPSDGVQAIMFFSTWRRDRLRADLIGGGSR